MAHGARHGVAASVDGRAQRLLLGKGRRFVAAAELPDGRRDGRLEAVLRDARESALSRPGVASCGIRGCRRHARGAGEKHVDCGRARFCIRQGSHRRSILKPSDIRIDEVIHGYEHYVYRAPYKFGGRVVDRVTLLNVHCRVSTRDRRTAWGFGSMTMGNIWAFPSVTMPYDTTLEAMKALASRIARLAGDCTEVGHPLDIAHVLEPECHKAAAEISAERKLAAPIPQLCTLVAASPFDAALHDALGKVPRHNVHDTRCR